jgi:hypothetical protein
MLTIERTTINVSDSVPYQLRADFILAEFHQTPESLEFFERQFFTVDEVLNRTLILRSSPIGLSM